MHFCPLIYAKCIRVYVFELILSCIYLSHFLFWICRCMKPMLLEEYWLHTLFSCYSWRRKLLHVSTVCCYSPEPTQSVQNKFTLHFTLLLNSVLRYNLGHFTFSPINVTSSHTYKAMLKHETINILLNKKYASVARYMCNILQHFKLYNM